MADNLFNADDAMFADMADIEAPVDVVSPSAPDPAPQESDAGAEQPQTSDGAPVVGQDEPPAVPKDDTGTKVEQPLQPSKQQIDPEQFKGYLDEREKRQKLQTELETLKQQLEERNQQPSQIPSVTDDPIAWEQYQQQLVQQTRVNTIFDVSETMAREKHGDEAVSAAMEWALAQARQSPAFAAEYANHKHPIDWAVKQQKRHALMDKIGDDEEAFIRARAAELGIIAATPQTTEPQSGTQAAHPHPTSQKVTTPNPSPTKSIAGATSAGGLTAQVPAGEFAALEAMFNR